MITTATIMEPEGSGAGNGPGAAAAGRGATSDATSKDVDAAGEGGLTWGGKKEKLEGLRPVGKPRQQVLRSVRRIEVA